jgi:hypothetical protein
LIILDTYTSEELVYHLELSDKRLSLKERIEKYKIAMRAEIEELRANSKLF